MLGWLEMSPIDSNIDSNVKCYSHSTDMMGHPHKTEPRAARK